MKSANFTSEYRAQTLPVAILSATADTKKWDKKRKNLDGLDDLTKQSTY